MNCKIKPQIIIGIDPDVEASGLGAIFSFTDGGIYIQCETFPLPDLISTLIHHAQRAAAMKIPIHVYVEAGWLNKGNWHVNPRDTRQAAAAKGRQAGRNHQLGLDICAFLDHHKISHTEVMPLIKCWKGRDRKITHDEMERIIRSAINQGMPRKRSNQEERDALLLAWEKSGLPIKC